MHFRRFLKLVEELPQDRPIAVQDLVNIVDTHHFGVGTVKIRTFPDFPGAQPGNFIWLEEERTSPYEEPFQSAIINVNARFMSNRSMRRLVIAKELMHVFDDDIQKVADSASFVTLLNEIASQPVIADASAPYAADNEAFWKAILALIPPRIRSACKASVESGSEAVARLAAYQQLPEVVITMAATDYYERFLAKCTSRARKQTKPK